MTGRIKLAIAVAWVLSLFAVAQWTGRAQSSPQLGQEVRFLRSQGDGRTNRGVLVANFGGQWLPVTLDEMPDANEAQPIRPVR
jgi:hypothetical protein